MENHFPVSKAEQGKELKRVLRRQDCFENQMSQLRLKLNHGTAWRWHYYWLVLTCPQLAPQSPPFTSCQGQQGGGNKWKVIFHLQRILTSTSLTEVTHFNSEPRHLLPNWLQTCSPSPLLSSREILFEDNSESMSFLFWKHVQWLSPPSDLSSASQENHTAAPSWLPRWWPPFKPCQGVNGLCTSTWPWMLPSLLLSSFISPPTKRFGEVQTWTLEPNSFGRYLSCTT